MGKHSLSSIAKSVRTAMKKHSPEILTGIGIAGMITTTVMAVRATPKALILIEEKKDELETDQQSLAQFLFSVLLAPVRQICVGTQRLQLPTHFPNRL